MDKDSDLDYYIEQHRQLHLRSQKNFRGRALPQHIPSIDRLMGENNCHTILDYGCGKAECWPEYWQVTGYDPAHEPYAHKPEGPYDMVICTDVMEHIPESATDHVLSEIFGYARHWVYLCICTRTSHRTLPAGGSVHVNVQSEEWWNQRLAPYSRYTVVYTQ